MDMDYFEEKFLVKRLSAEEEISFIFGAALTAKRNGVGIPGVSEAVEFAREYAKSKGIIDDFEELTRDLCDKDMYQAAFSCIAALSPKGIREVIKNVVSSNIDSSTGKHRIPKAIIDLVNFIKNSDVKVKNIITTNFDTLIEEQLSNEGINYNSISIVSDSHINENDNGYINIIHIHGVWNKGDTMHTRNQLETRRVKIQGSLRKFLSKDNLYIMAYSGWEDSFTHTLANLMNDDEAEYSIAWCFYENSEGQIDRESRHLTELLNPAISHERAQFFRGVDCDKVFENLNKLGAPKKKP